MAVRRKMTMEQARKALGMADSFVVCGVCGHETLKDTPICGTCGYVWKRLAGCGENTHADGSSTVFHENGCDGSCGLPKEGKAPPRNRRQALAKKGGPKA